MRREKIRAFRPFEWALPPRPARREVISRLPANETGKPHLLFVHGIEHSARCFDEHWLPYAAKRGFPAHAVSLRGHGNSGGRDGLRRTTLRDYVHDVIQSAVSLPSQPVLIGHSLGGLVVARAMTRYPARGAVLASSIAVGTGIGSAISLGRRSPIALFASLIGKTIPLRPQWLFEELDADKAADHASRLGPESPLAQYQIVFHRAPGKPLGDAPVLVMGTKQDKLLPASDVRRTARYYGTKAVFHEGFGHDMMLEKRWHEPLDTILAWIDELQTAV